MKLTIERAALLAVLGHAQGVVERRNTIPILSNAYLEAGDGRLRVTATDLDIAVTESVAADVAQTGATTASAHTLHDIVRKLPEGAQIEMAYAEGDGRLSLCAGRSEFSLACLPKEDFPVMAEGTLPHSFVIGGPELERLIDKSRFAVSTEETRYYLNGIYLHAAEASGFSVLRAVATDGHRLARVDMPMPEGAAGMPGVIVPRKAVTEIRKLIDACDSEVEIGLSESKIRFAFDDLVLTSKLIDGTFPDYGRVIPEGNDKVMEVDGKSFADAVDRVATVSPEKSRAVKLELDKDRLVLSATSDDSGSASEELSVTYGEEKLEIGFDSRYLLDITGLMEGENAQFFMADAASPTLVRDNGDDGALFVVMPMRV